MKKNLRVLFFLIISLSGFVIAAGIPVVLGFITPKNKTLTASSGFVESGGILADSPNSVCAIYGDWEYYPDKLYYYSDFKEGRTDAAQFVSFPHIWTKDSGRPAKGYATYRVRIRMPELRTIGKSIYKLGVYVRPQFSAYRAFLGVEFAAGSGIIDADFDNFKSDFYTDRGYRSYSEDELFEQDYIINLIIQIQNEHNARPGLSGAVYIGDGEYIKNFSTDLIYLSAYFHGLLAMFFGTFLFVFIHERSHAEYFDYAVSCLMFLYLTVTKYCENILYRTAVNFINADLLQRFEYAALLLCLLFTARQAFISFFDGTNKYRPRKALNYIYAFSGLMTALYLFMPFELITAVPFVNNAIIVVLAASSFIIKFVVIIKKFIESLTVINSEKHSARLVSTFNLRIDCLIDLGSLICLFLTVCFLMTGVSIWHSIEIAVIVFIVHCHLQGISFLRIFHNTQRELHHITETLEERIESRTRQLSEMKEKAESATSAKSNFLANMSHEIRTPINAVLGMCELVLRESNIKTAHEYAANVKQASLNLLAIINDILDFSKIEAGKFDVVTIEYSFASLIHDTISIIQLHIAEKSLLFTVNIDPALPAGLIGDEIRVRQILLNLLNNAVKYTDSGHISLEISGVHKDDEDSIYLHIRVSDTGQGIRPEDMSSLFSEFMRIDTHKNRSVVGTGLGLSISRNLCRLMGGDLTVESVYKEGSVFTAVILQKIGKNEPFASVKNPEEKSVLLYETRTIYASSISENLSALNIRFRLTDDMEVFKKELNTKNWKFAFFPSIVLESALDYMRLTESKAVPVILTAPNDTSVSGTDPVLPMPIYALTLANALNGVRPKQAAKENYTDFIAPAMKILVVDDIITNLKVMKGLLAPYQCQVDLCSKGSQSINILKNEYYDIVFMDHMMPEIDGIEVTKQIRELDVDYAKTIPIIALTANAISGMREMFLSSGFNDYLAKPIEISKLNEIMEYWTPAEKIIHQN